MLTSTSSVFTGLSWNPAHDVHELFTFPFMVHALAAGTIVAVMAGVVGWFMVLRRQTFAGHTLSVTAFTGASAAGLAGVPVLVGYFGVCGLGAVALAAAAGTRRALSSESAATGSIGALALALGFLFVSLYHGVLNGLDSLLFGTFLGITSGQVQVLLEREGKVDGRAVHARGAEEVGATDDDRPGGGVEPPEAFRGSIVTEDQQQRAGAAAGDEHFGETVLGVVQAQVPGAAVPVRRGVALQYLDVRLSGEVQHGLAGLPAAAVEDRDVLAIDRGVGHDLRGRIDQVL